MSAQKCQPSPFILRRIPFIFFGCRRFAAMHSAARLVVVMGGGSVLRLSRHSDGRRHRCDWLLFFGLLSTFFGLWHLHEDI